jgi:hypothetical protein
MERSDIDQRDIEKRDRGKKWEAIKRGCWMSGSGLRQCKNKAYGSSCKDAETLTRPDSRKLCTL